MSGDKAVSLTDVLQVVMEFESFEPDGVSSGLVAWELKQHEGAIGPVIEAAAEQELLAPAGVDDRSGQQLWRLTAQGRSRLLGD